MYRLLKTYICRFFSSVTFATFFRSKSSSFFTRIGPITAGSASCSSSRKAAAPILKNMSVTPKQYSFLPTPHTSEMTSQKEGGSSFWIFSGMTCA